MYVILALFPPCLALAGAWLWLLPRFLQRLHDRHGALYRELGSPVMRFLWWSCPARDDGHGSVMALPQGSGVSLETVYSPQELGAMWRLGRFLLRGRFAGLEPGSLRLARWLRVIAATYLVLFASIALGIVGLALTGS